MVSATRCSSRNPRSARRAASTPCAAKTCAGFYRSAATTRISIAWSEMVRTRTSFPRSPRSCWSVHMHNVNGKQLAVRLPKLGPLIGWLRRDDGDGSVLARLWAKADDGYGAAPLAAVTVPWDKSCNRPAGKPSFWPMRVVRLEEADPGAKVEQLHYFAVADVRLRADSVVRMAFVHGLYPKDAGA